MPLPEAKPLKVMGFNLPVAEVGACRAITA